jgi:hypothetical protein
MNNDEMNDDVGRLFPSHVSDETVMAFCDFLASLVVVAESHYYHQLRRYHEAHRQPVDSQHPWRTKIRED